MATFRRVKLKDVAEINSDSIGRSFQYETIGYVDISSVGIGNLTEIQEMRIEDAPSRAKRLVKSGDTILSTVRPNRRSFFYFKEPKENVVISTGFAVLRALGNNNPRYLYYSVTDKAFTDYLTKNAKGAAYPAVDADIIYDGEVFVPETTEDQARIASVLSTYDDLIENNENRIKALEAMAQLLYTEWFVKFKFPGHEKVKMIDSGTDYGMISDGWEVGMVSDLANVISGFPFRGSTYQEKGKYKIVTIKNVHDGVFVLNFDSFIDELPVKLPKTCILNQGDILLSLTGNVGRICMVYGSDHLLNQRVAKLSPIKMNKREYIYSLFRQKIFQQKLEAMSNGAAQQNLSPIQVKDIKVIIPNVEILDEFSRLAGKYLDMSLSLQEENINLSKTRDLLIPQLVTGRRDIENK